VGNQAHAVSGSIECAVNGECGIEIREASLAGNVIVQEEFDSVVSINWF